MLSYCAIGQNRQAGLSIAKKCAILGGMAFTAFVSKSKPGNQAHNERDFDANHPEPAYFLPRSQRGDNIHITQDLTAKEVYRDYVRTSAYGRKSGRLHHSAKPVREAVIVCTMNTTEKEVRDLIEKLEKGLGIRALYAHVHKDEGHIDEETWEVKHNPHIHFGYTNLVIERDEQGRRQGKLTDMNRPKMRKAQDICAEALGMERAPHYTKETRKKNLSHQAFRAVKEIENRVQAALDAAEEKPQTAEEKTGSVEQRVSDLVAENKRLRNALKNSGKATQENYKGLKQIKDSDLPEREKVVKMAKYVDKVLTPVEETPTPAPAVSLFADTLWTWMERERKKREQDEEEDALNYNALVDEHNELSSRYSDLVEKCKPWLNLVEQFAKNGLHMAQRVLKAGMVKYDIWHKLGPQVMDDPPLQPPPAPEQTRSPTRTQDDDERD